LIDKLSKNDFVFDTKTINLRLFSKEPGQLDPWKKALNLDKAHDFRVGNNQPVFLNEEYNRIFVNLLNKIK